MSKIRVHFAGAEMKHQHLALVGGNVHYSLYSVYKYIATKKNGADLLLPQGEHTQTICDDFKSTIQDSGLFTLMFGAEKGGTYDLKFFEGWQDRIIQFVTQNKLNPKLVEIDCQKVLGVEEAWSLRERMKQKLPNYTHINVWHFEDGSKGLDRMLEFSDYIALSIPEWRIARRKTYRDEIHYLTHYIKNKKPEIDIHLLGCTETQMLKDNDYCTSSDSTTWLGPTRWGYFGDVHVSAIKEDVIAQKEKVITQIANSRGMTFTASALRDTAIRTVCACVSKKEYEAACGNQD